MDKLLLNLRVFRIVLVVFLLGVVGIMVWWAIYPNESPSWTGFGKFMTVRDVERSKTLWDWMDLLIIPLALGVLAMWYKSFESRKAKKAENQRHQNQVLDDFVKILTELIIKHGLTKQDASIEIRTIARTRINIALGNLDSTRKGQILQFLFEASLIDENPKINLNGANIKDSNLDGIVLSKCEIRGAYFINTSLKRSNLNEAIFIGSDFTSADFTSSLMRDTNLSYCYLNNAKLKNLDLTSVKFEGADLTNADLSGSKIKRSQLNSIHEKKGIKTNKTEII